MKHQDTPPDTLGTTSLRRSPFRSRARPRGGYSLMEMLVTISINGVVLVVLTGMLTTLLRQDRESRRLSSDLRSLGRLANQFRADVRQSTSVSEIPDANGSFVCRLPQSQSVKYELKGSRLIRTRDMLDGKVRREAYMLPAGSTIGLDTSSDKPPLVTMMIAYRPAADAEPTRRAIVATLGHDLRWRGDSP